MGFSMSLFGASRGARKGTRLFRTSFRQLCLIAIAALVFNALSPATPAQVQRNAGFESTTFALVKARLVVSPDDEVDQGTLVIRDGLIVAAGKDVALPADAEIIDGTGLIVYPGFVDAATSVLLDPNRGTTP